ncbi:MAG: radical SAM/SPASM domain-containing protein [Clostridium paraputrificum]|uniref:radical SAM/SPASM domain-containing protein n=1 Tax=Clostridium paraputrificum TaxID=29363 RepID=UPI000C070F0C|nr:radical SAM protein [Clostridium paraputrificum]
MRRNLSVMVKPSSSKCNLKCKYCFYNSIADEREVSDYGFLSEEALEVVVNRIDEYCDGGFCNMGFQGGEPMLIGLDFYKKLVELTSSKKTKFNFMIQTNGTLITEEFAKFFYDNKFLVGISLDGNKDMHDLNRVNHSQNGSFKEVMKGISLLKKYNVNFNILVVVTRALSKKIESCYKFLRENDFNYIQFIPFIEALEDCNNNNLNFHITSKQYEDYIKKLFDMWYEDVSKGKMVSIRYFDNILGLFLGQDYEACDMRGICSCQHIIESDGRVYPCDFYTYEKYSIGNIFDESFDNMHEKEITRNFIIESVSKDKKCETCKYRALCRGGCKRYRATTKDNRYMFCEANYKFFEYSYDRFRELAIKISNRR